MPWLICTSGEDRGMQQELVGRPIVIGRAPDADVRIIDERSSRYHCKVWLVHGKLMVEDLNSTNGVKFKGKRYQGDKIKLSEGESFAIGSDVFTYAKAKDAYLEAAEDMVSELNKRKDQTVVAERTYNEVLKAEMQRKKGVMDIFSSWFRRKK